MNAYQYAVVNEYGAVLLDTVSDTIGQTLHLFYHKFGMSPLDQLGCCIVQIRPVVVDGKPHGYWYQGEK